MIPSAAVTTSKALRAARELLSQRNESLVAQCVDLLASLGDPAHFDALLAGTTWTPPQAPNTFGELTPGVALDIAPHRGAWRLWAALRLIAAAPEGSVGASLRQAITSLHVHRRVNEDEALPADLAPLAALRNLTSLCIDDVATLCNLSALATLPSLERLSITQRQGRIDLSGLAGSPALRELTVYGAELAGETPLALPALQRLDLFSVGMLVGLALVEGMPSLDYARINNITACNDLSPFGACTALRELRFLRGAAHLTNLRGLEPCVALERLDLAAWNTVTSFEGLEHARALTRLRAPLAPIASLAPLAGLTRLTELYLGYETFADVDALAGCDLHEIELKGEAIESLRGLRGSRSLRALVLEQAPRLKSLDGLEGCIALESLEIRACSALVDLSALRRHPALRRLALHFARALRDLTPLAACAALVECTLEQAPVEDVTPLATLPALEFLALHGCSAVKDVAPLAASQTLRAVLLRGTGVSREDIPAAMRRVASCAADATFKSIAAKPPPAPRKAPTRAKPTAHDALLPKLKKLLLSRDAALIDQGVVLVGSLGDATLYDTLLAGVRWVAAEGDDPLAGTIEMAGSFFDDTAPARPFRLRAVLALAAEAPAECAAATALKGAVTALALDGDVDPKRAIAIDLAPLRAFTALQQLEARGSLPCTGADRLAGHPALASLTWRGGRTATLPDLAALPALREVQVRGVTEAVWEALGRVPKLHRLWLYEVEGDTLDFSPFHELRTLSLGWSVAARRIALRGCAVLRELTVGSAEHLVSLDLTGCGALTKLFLDGCRSLKDIVGFEELTALETLTAFHSSPAWLPAEPVPSLQRLTTLALHGCHVPDAVRVAHFPAVSSLDLTNAIGLQDVSALATMRSLRTVDLSHCLGVSDVSALAGLPLTRLRVYYTAVHREKVPPALRKAVTMR